MIGARSLPMVVQGCNFVFCSFLVLLVLWGVCGVPMVVLGVIASCERFEGVKSIDLSVGLFNLNE